MAATHPDDDIPPPRLTADLLGHQAAETAFLDAWTGGRLAHAWLITGPKGIGKATFAYRIARFVLSGGGDSGGLFGGPPENLDMDAGHPVFRRIAAGGHADFKVVERGWSDEKKGRLRSDIIVEDVRGVGAFMSLTPAEGGWRVVIVDAADEMNRSSANAILKVLEEPPRNALMLLVSHSPGRLLPTIRSRCRRLSLGPLPDATVVALLGRYRPDLAASDAQAVARLAEGSVGRALALAAEGGLDLYREMFSLLSAVPAMPVAALHAFADKVARGEETFRTAGDLLTWWLAAAARAGAGQPTGEVVDGEAQVQRRLVRAAGLDRWVEVWEKARHLCDRAEAVNLDRKQVILDAFLSLERQCRSNPAIT